MDSAGTIDDGNHYQNSRVNHRGQYPISICCRCNRVSRGKAVSRAGEMRILSLVEPVK